MSTRIPAMVFRPVWIFPREGNHTTKRQTFSRILGKTEIRKPSNDKGVPKEVICAMILSPQILTQYNLLTVSFVLAYVW